MTRDDFKQQMSTAGFKVNNDGDKGLDVLLKNLNQQKPLIGIPVELMGSTKKSYLCMTKDYFVLARPFTLFGGLEKVTTFWKGDMTGKKDWEPGRVIVTPPGKSSQMMFTYTREFSLNDGTNNIKVWARPDDAARFFNFVQSGKMTAAALPTGAAPGL